MLSARTIYFKMKLTQGAGAENKESLHLFSIQFNNNTSALQAYRQVFSVEDNKENLDVFAPPNSV